MSEIAIDLWVPGRGWRVRCTKQLSPKCKSWFYSGTVQLEECGQCYQAQHDLDKLAAAERREKTGLTPDDHPETGYVSIFTEEERFRYRLGVGKWV